MAKIKIDEDRNYELVELFFNMVYSTEDFCGYMRGVQSCHNAFPTVESLKVDLTCVEEELSKINAKFAIFKAEAEKTINNLTPTI
jgi:hypothetical protein